MRGTHLQLHDAPQLFDLCLVVLCKCGCPARPHQRGIDQTTSEPQSHAVGGITVGRCTAGCAECALDAGHRCDGLRIDGQPLACWQGCAMLAYLYHVQGNPPVSLFLQCTCCCPAALWCLCCCTPGLLQVCCQAGHLSLQHTQQSKEPEHMSPAVR